MVGSRVTLMERLHGLIGTITRSCSCSAPTRHTIAGAEGRKLWGQLVNDSRNLAIKVAALAGVAQARPGTSVDCRRLRQRLEGTPARGRSAPVSCRSINRHRPAGGPTHVPANIALMVRRQIVRWRQEGAIDGYEELLLDPHARALMDICGACERIRKTPFIPSYRKFIRGIIFIYLLDVALGSGRRARLLDRRGRAGARYFMLGTGGHRRGRNGAIRPDRG